MAEVALWQQNVAYPARQDRVLVSELFGEGVIDVAGGALLVTERSAGANMSVDIAAGRCVVDGDEQADQETYLAAFDDATNLAVASADPDNPRKDRVIVRVADSAVSGTADGPIREVLTGTPGVSPSAPPVPDSAISLAIVDVPAGTASITDADIADDRSKGSAGGIAGENFQTDSVGGSEESTTSTSYTDLATVGPQVTARVGASGKVMVLTSGRCKPGTDAGMMSFVTSGANTASASDSDSIRIEGYALRAGVSTLITGLAEGDTTFTAKYKSLNGGSVTWAQRTLVVVPV